MSLTLQQIVDMADKRVPNTETDADKVLIIDQLQRQLFRRFTLPENIESISTVTNQSLYTLPSYIIPSRIKSVVMTDSSGSRPTKHSMVNYTTELIGNCYYTVETPTDSFIRIYPTPTASGSLIFINFEESPNALSSSNMEGVPRFAEDYHMLFVYGLCVELANIRKDVELSNNYTLKYNELYSEAVIKLRKIRPSLVKAPLWR